MALFTEPANFHFVKDKAYTEDEVLVYNIFVHKIPRKTSKAEFSEYFKKFGDVESVRLLNQRNKRPNQKSAKIGFVKYSDALSAAKVLKNINHLINKKCVSVRACDSWHQPDAQPRNASGTAGEETTTDDDEALILNLNDDCLDAILKHLEMQDQINMARCCRRFKDVFAMRAKVEYKNLDLGELEFLTLWQIRQFLQMTGSQIEKLFGHSPHNNFERVVEFLGIYCISVKSISMTSEALTMTHIRKLLLNMQMIEELQLIDADLKDEGVAVLKKLKKLKILSLDENYDLTGKHIKDLTTVESLSLNACKRIMPSFFEKICENLKELKYLDIQECSHLHKFANGDDIVKHLHKLETIKLSCDNSELKSIASLPSLKHLYLHNEDPFGQLSSTIFTELAKHRAEHLETLDIRAYNSVNHEKSKSIGVLKKLKVLMCPNNDQLNDKCLLNIAQLEELEMLNIKNCKGFTTMGLLDVIKNCTKLKILNISNCKHLKEEFATMVLQLLQSTKQQRDQKQPLKIIAHNSGIPHFTVNTSDFETASDLLKLSFDYEMDSIYCDNISTSDTEYDDYFYGHDEDDDYMYFSEPESDFSDNNVLDDLDVAVLQRFMFRRLQHPYGDDIHDVHF